jgi:hypothetical protein
MVFLMLNKSAFKISRTEVNLTSGSMQSVRKFSKFLTISCFIGLIEKISSDRLPVCTMFATTSIILLNSAVSFSFIFGRIKLD